jgi:pimeloyl-ACP methyl ester carboxylesterase
MSDFKTVELDHGPITYRESGPKDGEPIVFVHGFLVDSRLWDGPAGVLSGEYRCIQPDLPMGSHRTPMKPDADLTPPGVARLLRDFLEALDLQNVTIVGNDSGGAMSQILVTRHPERIARLVLTNCDSYEHFPPSLFKAMPPMTRIPGAMWALGQPMRLGLARRIAYGPFTKTELPDELLASWTEPVLQNPAIRRDTTKLVADMTKRYTLEAAAHFPELEIPVLLTWGREDGFFKPAQAERLAAAIPGARLEWIDDAKTFLALDQPEVLAERIGSFMRETSPAPAAT